LSPSNATIPPSGVMAIQADRAKNVNKLGQLGRSVNKFPGRSFALRSSFASASRIMPSLAWLYSLNTSASPDGAAASHVIGYTAGAQPRREGVPHFVKRKVVLVGSELRIAKLARTSPEFARSSVINAPVGAVGCLYEMLLYVQLRELPEPNLTLSRINFAIDLPHSLIAQAHGLPLAGLIAIWWICSGVLRSNRGQPRKTHGGGSTHAE